MPDPTPAAAPASAAVTSQAAPTNAPAPVTAPVNPATPAPAVAPEPADATNAAPPAPVVPEKYDLKLPDGAPLDAAHLEAVASFAKDAKLPQDVAQKMVERDVQMVAQVFEKAQADWKAKTEAWLESSKTDKEIGGDKFTPMTKAANDVIAKYGSPELRKLMDETGAGNHPEFIRIFARLGQAMADDKMTLPAGGGTGAPAGDVYQRAASQLYGNPAAS